MSNPFVLAREVTGEPFVAKIGDEEFTFTHPSHLNQVDLAELFAAGDDMTNVEFMVGLFRLASVGDSFDRLRKVGLGSKEMAALYTAYNAHAGADEGESAASSD